jgi:molybdopterin/thiamine biosynthesis adenylyltransferase
LGDPIWTVSTTLKEKGFSLSYPPSTYRGSIHAHGNSAAIEIEIPDLTFVEMPKVRLLSREGLPSKPLAHINSDDTICYVGEGGLPLDLYDPGGSVLRVLREAEIALERSFGGGAGNEFEGELASYWQGRFNVYVTLPRITASKIYRAEMLNIRTNQNPLFVIVPTGERNYPSARSRRSVTILSLPTNLRHEPAFRSKTLAGMIDWLTSQATVREAVTASATTSEPIFVVSPNAIIGWESILPANLKMLQKSGGVRKEFLAKQVEKSLHHIGLERMTGIRSDLENIVQRNLLGKPSLIGKKISLIGVGTIGANLARLLVQSGAGCGEDFSVYDTDVFQPGNLGRHVLGFADLDRPKVEAMADILRLFHPDVRVRPFNRNALKEWDTLERSNLIIDATGDYNVAAALNHLRMKSEKDGSGPAILHAWVFGNGIAAQTFLNLKDGLGCYRCLRPAFDGPWRYAPVKDVKKLVQLAPALCGEAGYIPFAADAPMVAASLALRATLDWAARRPGQRFRTITLDHEDGKDVKWASPPRYKGCPACGS